ncbi:MAG: ABC transporter substrate-binding protein [Candidatus Faecousia sp.]|nr:ABC transporter substrate-binding protein [Bacillota bacterium]MDY4220820.1 ABC transporter substrate-binding protein [Candidatus Faecousia sp.]
MKKIIALLLASVLVLGLFAACSNGSKENATGSVYYLNFKPEADQAWQDLAATYTEKTGVTVKVVTAASGTYEDTLTAEMGKASAPTLFQCGNAQALLNWNEYCLDLSDTDVYKEMTTDDFNLKDESGAVKAIGYCYECYGIIVNKALLQQAGHSLDEIKDFASLKAVADDIHANAATLGFDAFASAGLDSSSSWRFSGHLANMPLFYEFRDDGVTEQPATITGAYLDNFKNIWDLYITDSAADPTSLSTATGDQAQAEFGTGKAVFWQNGSWEYANLIDAGKYGMNPDDLTMIPIYCGVSGEEKSGLCCGTENCWAVNAKASEADIQATLDFLKWVVTSDEGTTMMAEQFGPIPFKNAKTPENKFFAAANDYTAAGNYVVTWAFNYTPNVDDWRAGVVSALTAYSAGTGSWDEVVNAFVQGWAHQYTVQNG